MNYFSNLYSEIKYPIATETEAGLRNAQIGAIHAIASHSTIKPVDAAIVVMPTGSGKTAVLMVAPFVLRKEKVLIVTPSVMVRGQITEEFKELQTLKAVGVLSKDTEPPIVFEAMHTYSEDYANDIIEADVVVASHHVAATISESEAKGLFDYVIIDEAHHVPAPTWQRIINNMSHAAALLVTATPFRLDRKEIKGDHIYNYPLSKAFRDGIFGSIVFIPIDEAPNKDVLIAKETERVLINDREEGFEHTVLVRTDTKDKAKALESLYREHTALKLKRIDSSMTYRTIRKTISNLKNHELDGIICVDMMGEGFDFPNLKIAAVHEPHKSLAATLQFVGRFARTNAETIGTAKFIAMNDENLRIENRKLYTSDAVWQDMIIEMSENKITDDLENMETIKQFTQPENGQEYISLHNIRPNCHARVYRVNGFNFDSHFPEECGVRESIYKNTETSTIVGLAEKSDTPLWLDGTQPINTEVNLFIVHYQQETKLMYIYSQKKTDVLYDAIAESFCEDYKKIPRDEMNRVLAGLENFEFFNTGMQNRYAENGESYRIYAGSNTAASIDETTGRMLSAGHAFCKATGAGAAQITIGYSSGSKFWSSQYLSIPAYVSWCDTFGKKIINNNIRVKTNTNYDNLPIPTGIKKYSEDILFAFFSEKVYLSPPSIRINGEDKIIGLLTDAELKVTGVTQSGDGVMFSVSIGDIIVQYVCDLSGRYSSTNDILLCRDGVQKTTLSKYFTDNPLMFKTADDTVYYANEVLQGNAILENYNPKDIIVINWEEYDADIRIEAGKTNSDKRTVQDALKQYLLSDDSYSHIIFDHGSGEIADYVTVKSDDTTIDIELYHCKAMKGNNYNSTVSDVYEVAQQAIKSTVWVKSKSFFLSKIQDRVKGGSTEKFIRGDIRSIKALLQSGRIMRTTIYIVQPALSNSTEMPDKIGMILSASKYFIRNTGRAKSLKIIGSK